VGACSLSGQGVPGSLVGDIRRRPVGGSVGFSQHSSSPRRRCRAPHEGVSVLRVRVRGDGRSGVLGGVCDRGAVAGARRASEPVVAGDGAGGRDHRAGHAELLAAGACVPAGRRLARSGRPRVRGAVVVLADRRAGGGLRADDRDLDRGGRQRGDRVCPGARADADPDRARPGGVRRRADVVRSRGTDDLRGDDLLVHHRRRRGAGRRVGLPPTPHAGTRRSPGRPARR
jgi:hypothetical protein